MSKKKTSTTKPEASRPSIIPIMKKKGGKAKPQTKAKADADQALATPVPSDAPPPEGATGQETAATATPETPTETVPAIVAAAQPTTSGVETPSTGATGGASQAPTPAEETPPADAGGKKNRGTAKAPKEPRPKKMSCLDAAAKVLADAGTPMTCQEMITAMAAKKLWSSPGGQTPSATVYSAILREINTKGANARFTKVERGKFAAKG